MPRMQVIYDGVTWYDDNIHDLQLPPTLPRPLPMSGDPIRELPPYVRAAMLQALGGLIRKGLQEGPLLQPLTINHQTRDTGWTLTVDTPKER